ncbi:ABC transporter ATP-binding protein [Rhodopila sp.]|jgi:sulfonate transport system ATP-binding protein|uniref:ABC transporter ATP-binding protein n=1 Tax=Rhodopila sp. TaxID=2480087 RepID=UPI002C86BC2D|nr:ATP-binding cassette domain-containing protein [Rhodopila sp.]HVZ08003.1 ATP-binding cassette domain-containing protein [Rhodopila sp.]
MNVSVLDTRPDTAVRISADGAHLRLHGVTKSFGALTVLDDIDLEIPAGQFVAIVGRSGCGKSTLLRLLAGLDQPSAGRIEIDGETGKWRDRVRLMFQEPRLLPWQRVAANVAVGLPHARSSSERRDLAQDALEQVGLGTRGGDWPSLLSGGQKQRVALARALVSHPAVLAFDEPLGALDALTRIDMQALIVQVWCDKGFTAIVVTHDVAEAVTLADRILVLDHGRVAKDVMVELPRPRRHGDAAAAAIEGRILDRLLARHEA